MAIILTPVSEFEFPEPGPHMFTLTCKNHPTARYLTKNPYQRGLHFTRAADGFGAYEECPCSFADLMVMTSDISTEEISRLIDGDPWGQDIRPSANN